MRRSYFICEHQGSRSAKLLTTEPLDYHQADAAIDKLVQAEAILPEASRRKLFAIDLEALLPKEPPKAE